jgi:hypothetical protein
LVKPEAAKASRLTPHSHASDPLHPSLPRSGSPLLFRLLTCRSAPAIEASFCKALVDAMAPLIVPFPVEVEVTVARTCG